VALITGAASGIGRATAELFVANGWWVAAADVDRAGLDELAAELGQESCGVWELDVTDAPAFRRVVGEVAAVTGDRLDLLFNNAGIGAGGFFEEIPIEVTRRVIDVNLIGVVNGIYAALPLLKNTPGSLCFSTSSSSAVYGAAGLAIYSATKFAVKGLTEALSVELSRYEVRVADTLPGVIDTAIFGASPVYVEGERMPDGLAASASDQAAPDGPFRLIQPRAVADAVWQSYAGDPRLHWYVPADLEGLEHEKLSGPESMRDSRIQRLRESLAPGDADD
jgi:NAD(P)-dependent dehydrogenase (short-subunit alcohol dehydrogenase family)